MVGHLGREGRIGFTEGELYFPVAGGLNLFQVYKRTVFIELDPIFQPLYALHHRFCVKRRAVVKLDALSQVSRPHLVRVVGYDLFGQLRHGLQVFVEVGEAFPYTRAAVDKTAAIRAVVKVPPDTDYQ
ncbi:MAG: hypothetical protein DDT30_01800 [Dehalococcoidia bacterium]|nr:hypothetical protein [Bacillota bacterium]MBT9143578.1 hypothetical protein [Bacillota bacterium]